MILESQNSKNVNPITLVPFTIPCGTTDFDRGKNLPVGLQIIAPHLAEAKLLKSPKPQSDERSEAV